MDLGHVHLVGFLRLLRASDGWLRPPTLPGCSVASEGDSRGLVLGLRCSGVYGSGSPNRDLTLSRAISTVSLAAATARTMSISAAAEEPGSRKC